MGGKQQQAKHLSKYAGFSILSGQLMGLAGEIERKSEVLRVEVTAYRFGIFLILVLHKPYLRIGP